jgi:hypothetical protein
MGRPRPCGRKMFSPTKSLMKPELLAPGHRFTDLCPFPLAVLLLLGLAAEPRVQAQNNSYIGLTTGGKWENGANWSLGIPPNLSHSVRISNGVAGPPPLFKTVIIDATTANVPSSMIVSDLRLGGTLVQNELSVNNVGLATPFNVLSSLIISNNGTLAIANSSVIVKGAFYPSEGISVDGSLLLSSGSLLFTNTGATRFAIGYNRNGFVNMTGGTWTNGLYASMELGSKPGTSGILYISGGTAEVSGQYFGVGVATNSTGTVLLTGGELRTRDPKIGMSGTGQMTVSNGVWRGLPGNYVAVGAGAGGQGTVTLAGGTSIFPSPLLIPYAAGATGSLWVTGGELITTNSYTSIGQSGFGQMAVSNGVWRARDVNLGSFVNTSSTTNVLSIAGGSTLLSSNLAVGTPSYCLTNNLLAVSGGTLILSNAAHDAKLLVGSGTFTLSGGTVKVDTIDLSNPCARFVRTGGTLIYQTAILDPARDDDGDDLTNALEQSLGYDPLNPADGFADYDGDGSSNADEILAGTNPTNAASQLRIRSLLVQGDDVRIRWSTGGGRLNAIQVADSMVGGTSNFVDLAYIPIPGSGDKTNTYVDVDGAKQGPARFYRIKLVR